MKNKTDDVNKIPYFTLIPVVLAVIIIAFLLVRYRLLNDNHEFINIATAEQVQDIVTSEFAIGEVSKTEIETALTEGIFKGVDCSSFNGTTDISDSGIICEGLGSYGLFFPKYYRIFFGFSNDILSEIEVYFSYPNAP